MENLSVAVRAVAWHQEATALSPYSVLGGMPLPPPLHHALPYLSA